MRIYSHGLGAESDLAGLARLAAVRQESTLIEPCVSRRGGLFACKKCSYRHLTGTMATADIATVS